MELEKLQKISNYSDEMLISIISILKENRSSLKTPLKELTTGVKELGNPLAIGVTALGVGGVALAQIINPSFGINLQTLLPTGAALYGTVLAMIGGLSLSNGFDKREELNSETELEFRQFYKYINILKTNEDNIRQEKIKNGTAERLNPPKESNEYIYRLYSNINRIQKPISKETLKKTNEFLKNINQELKNKINFDLKSEKLKNLDENYETAEMN